MTNHIGWSEIAHDKWILALVQSLSNPLSDFDGAHFGFQIISRDPGRGNEFPIFTLILCLNPSVEEEGDMSKLFCFRLMTLWDLLALLLN